MRKMLRKCKKREPIGTTFVSANEYSVNEHLSTQMSAEIAESKMNASSL